MDRQKAAQYFKQMGFPAKSLASLGSYGQPEFTNPRDLIVAGDGIGLGLGVGAGPKDEMWRNMPGFGGLNQQDSSMWEPPIEHEPLLLRSFQTPKPPPPPPGPITVCTACTCCSTPRKPKQYSQNTGNSGTTFPFRHSPAAPVSVTDNEALGYQSGSESDTDDEGLSFEKLLTMMLRFIDRPASTAISTTLLRLASCFSPAQSLKESHVNQLMEFLQLPQTTMKEACFRVLERLLDTGWGWTLVSQSQLVDKVISLMGTSSPSNIQVLAMGVLDKMLNVPDLDFAQLRVRLEDEVYPCLLNNLHSGAALDVKYASCCLVRTLARDADFATRIKNESLFLLRQLRDSSARLREAYVGVVMAMFAHPGLTEAGSVDTGILPVVKGFLRDGPWWVCILALSGDTQRQALELLHCVMSDERGVEAVTSDQLIVAFIMACLLTSYCRKVRARASRVMAALTSLRRVGVARGVLEGISHYVHPHEAVEADIGGGGMARVTYPVPAKNLAEAHLWHNLDCFLDSVAGLFRSEGVIIRKSDCLLSNLPIRGDIGMQQLTCLSHLLQLITNLCTWPMLRRAVGFGNAQPAKLDVTHLCDDVSVKEKFTALNHRLAVQQWKRFGPSVFAILRWMSLRISAYIEQCNPSTVENLSSLSLLPNTSQASIAVSSTMSGGEIPLPCQRPFSAVLPRESTTSQASSAGRSVRPSSAKLPGSLAAFSQPISARPNPVVAKEILGEAEWILLHSLLNFLLCMTLVSCKTIPDPFSNPDKVKDAVSKPGSAASSQAPSASGSLMATAKKKPHPSGSVSATGLWVSENPHLTQGENLRGPGLKTEDIERKQLEETEKEAAKSRRVVRRGMYNEDLFNLLTPLVQLDDPEVKSICGLILRAAVQPLEEKIPASQALPSKSYMESGPQSYASFGQSSSIVDISSNRSPSTLNARKSEKMINIAVHNISPSSAMSVKEAIGIRPKSAPRSLQQPASESTGSLSPRGASDVHQLSATSTENSQRSKSSLSTNSGKPDSALGSSHHSLNLRSCLSTSQSMLHPLIVGQPVNKECQREAVEQCGCQVLRSLFSHSHRVKLYILMFLLDLTTHSQPEILMELSKLGIVPKLLDFLRINDQDEQLVILSLKVLKVLAESDGRLQQLFAHHGGHNLLMVLVRNPSSNIREQVRATLAAVTKGRTLGGGKGRGQRPSSAPTRGRPNSAKQNIFHPTDIWDHIMYRWAEEDRVVTVLQKFLVHQTTENQETMLA